MDSTAEGAPCFHDSFIVPHATAPRVLLLPCAGGWALPRWVHPAQHRRTARELDVFDRDDRLWLRRIPRPQGRFNAGQKLNAILTAAFAVLFAASGLLLWLGERDHRFRLDGTIVLHDGLMYVSLVLLVGHLYLAVIHPSTRHALRGMTTGSVDRHWALRHHEKWVRRSDT